MKLDGQPVTGVAEARRDSGERNVAASKSRTDLLAEVDKELRDKLLAEVDVQRAIEHVEKHVDKFAARRHLLATSTRLTPEMAETGGGNGVRFNYENVL